MSWNWGGDVTFCEILAASACAREICRSGKAWSRMNSGATMTLPIGTLDDDAWDDLLNFIEERKVIPIVGPASAYRSGSAALG